MSEEEERAEAFSDLTDKEKLNFRYTYWCIKEDLDWEAFLVPVLHVPQTMEEELGGIERGKQASVSEGTVSWKISWVSACCVWKVIHVE